VKAKLQSYYRLTKPGIIYGNVLTAAAGFLLAAKGHVDFALLFFTLIGTSLIIASACVFNNYIDRGIDNKMERTKQRALVLGTISARRALIGATILGIVGFAIIIVHTNWLVTLVGLIAFVDYIVFYGLSKRRSVHGTVVGSISGAAPVVAGYVAVTNRFDVGALLLFLILVAWQMPHFYAIALYRAKDYAKAGIPVLPLKSGLRQTKLQIQLYIGLFIAANILLSVSGHAGLVYAVVMTLVGLAWLRRSWRPFTEATAETWGRQLFLFSLRVIMLLSLLLAIDWLLP
jgi:protoheme IX farnesyltransferase